MNDITERKGSLRRSMREWRRSLTDDDIERRSERVVRRIEQSGVLDGARVVMGYTSVRGEPDLSAIATMLSVAGSEWVVPEDEPHPDRIDVVLVPGVAFTAGGDRLGQGGGWYDRFLPALRKGARVIGVCFAEQVLERIPIESHDVRVDLVVHDGVGDQASSAQVSS